MFLLYKFQATYLLLFYQWIDLICVGEPHAQKAVGEAVNIVRPRPWSSQVRSCLSSRVLMAYWTLISAS